MKHFSIYLKISIIFLLIYSCSKQNDWKTYDETSNFFIESILGVTFDQDIEELVDDEACQQREPDVRPDAVPLRPRHARAHLPRVFWQGVLRATVAGRRAQGPMLDPRNRRRRGACSTACGGQPLRHRRVVCSMA